jgi:HSP20 family protein
MRVRFRYTTASADSTAERQELERLVQELWRVHQRSMLSSYEWRPAIDVVEMPDQVLVRVELAGVPEEAVEISLYASRLVVSGRRTEVPPAGPQAAYREAGIHYGPFRVEVRLPDPVDAERVVATLDNGLLTIVLPHLHA